MVSQSGSPPIPMPVQVPPGHVMQQIVDENGTLRHVILSTQHQQMQGGVQGVQHHIGHYVSTKTELWKSERNVGICMKAQRFRNCFSCVQLQAFNKPRWYTFYSLRSTKTAFIMHSVANLQFCLLAKKGSELNKVVKLRFFIFPVVFIVEACFKMLTTSQVVEIIGKKTRLPCVRGNPWSFIRAPRIFCGFHWRQ